MAKTRLTYVDEIMNAPHSAQHATLARQLKTETARTRMISDEVDQRTRKLRAGSLHAEEKATFGTGWKDPDEDPVISILGHKPRSKEVLKDIQQAEQDVLASRIGGDRTLHWEMRNKSRKYKTVPMVWHKVHDTYCLL